jgi:uridine kinase
MTAPSPAEAGAAARGAGGDDVPGIEAAAERIAAGRARVPAGESMLVAVSGIDGAGKGHVTARLVAALGRRGLRIAGINLDGWLNLPPLRFSSERPAEHFYRHAIRFDELFERLILPLRHERSIRLEADLVEETAARYHRHLYEFDDVDAIVLEGIFLLKRALRSEYDARVWVECSFETALERALARGQEGLSREATIRAYETIYFPAQRIHFALDRPREAAEIVVVNDPRLAAPPGGGNA